jgi:lysozyme
MTITEQLIADEGLRLRPYRCPAGKLTIGVGRNLEDTGITKAEALLMLENDIRSCGDRLKGLPWFSCLNLVRQEVLINMAFNLGIGGLMGFPRMMAALERGQYALAAQEMIESKWATQVPQRARRLAEEMVSGVRKGQ